MGLEGAYGPQWQEPYGTTVGRTLTGATPAEAFPPAAEGGNPAMREALATTFGEGYPGSDHPEMQAVLRGALADGMPQADRALVNGAALEAMVARDPEALIDTRTLPREHLEAWQDLARRGLSGEIRVEMDTMNARTLREHRQSGAFGPVAVSDTWGRQSVYDARGGTVNMDYYAIRVDRMPRGVTPGQMLRDIRTSNFSTVTDRQESTFEGYGTGQVARGEDVLGKTRMTSAQVASNNTEWHSDHPEGSFVHIQIPGEGAVFRNSGTVAVIDADANHWTFVTAHSPLDDSHPVSGNREFGYADNGNGSYTFYTRGIDRIQGDFTMLQTWQVG